MIQKTITCFAVAVACFTALAAAPTGRSASAADMSGG